MSYGYAPSSREGTPILCKNCGAAMRLEGGFSTLAVCDFCGARDELPRDEAARYLELKNRLAYAKARALQVQGMDAALARVFEDKRAFWRVSGVYLGTAFVISLVSFFTLLSSGVSDEVPENYRHSLWMHQLFGPGMLLGVALSLGAGLLGGRRHFRRRVRPLLMARPLPAQPASNVYPGAIGAPSFGCRVCGAGLQSTGDASVTCGYCDSMNLFPASQHEAEVAEANRRAESLQHVARHAQVQMLSISSRMRWIVMAGVALSFITSYALPALLDRFVFMAR